MKFLKFEELKSTNDYIRRKLDIEEYDVVIAKKQTDGKGKRGSVWISNEGAALFSFTVNYDEYLLEKITIFSGYIVYEILKKYLPESKRENLKFKWPNDLYYENKKICGILCEKVRDFIIVGIGININNTDFGIFSEKAVSLFEIVGKEENIDEIIKEIVTLHNEKIEKMNKEWETIISDINENSYLKNRNLRIKINDVLEKQEYKYTRIDRSGEICLIKKGASEEIRFKSLDFEVL